MKTARVNGVELTVTDQGAGPPLLLVHGFPLDRTMWEGQIEGLSRRLRVIAPDLRGFGRSEVTDGAVTMQQFADDLAALLDVLEVREPVLLCGLSMGGYIALQFWRRHVARLRGLILCDTRAQADTPEAAAARREMAERVLREGPAPLVESMAGRLFAKETLRHRPELLESMREVMLKTGPQGIAAAARGMAERPDMTGALGEVRCPTLIIVGMSDVISPPEEMWLIAQAMRNAQYVEIAAAGHLAPLEQSAEVNATILEFLDTQC